MRVSPIFMLLACLGCLPMKAPSVVEGRLFNAYNIRWASESVQILDSLDFSNPIYKDYTIYNLPSSLCVVGLQLPPSKQVEYHFPLEPEMVSIKILLKDNLKHVIVSHSTDLSTWEMTHFVNSRETGNRYYSYSRNPNTILTIPLPDHVYQPDIMVPVYGGNSTHYERNTVYSYPKERMQNIQVPEVLLFEASRHSFYHLHIESMPLKTSSANGLQAKLFIAIIP